MASHRYGGNERKGSNFAAWQPWMWRRRRGRHTFGSDDGGGGELFTDFLAGFTPYSLAVTGWQASEHAVSIL